MNSELRELYQEVIIDHGRHPRNYHAMEDFSHQREGYNPLCGDRLTLYLRLSPVKNGEPAVIEDVSFQGEGCAISMASASMLTELLKGKTQPQAEALFEAFHQMLTQERDHDLTSLGKLRVLAGVREFPVRIKCATLAWHTLKGALGEEAVTHAGWVSTE